MGLSSALLITIERLRVPLPGRALITLTRRELGYKLQDRATLRLFIYQNAVHMRRSPPQSSGLFRTIGEVITVIKMLRSHRMT